MEKKVYLQNAGFVLTTGLSLVLSVLLFTSVYDSRLSWVILMSIALALELGKIITINDRKRAISVMLIGVSVLGSAGGLNRALTIADDSKVIHVQQRESIQLQVDQTLLAIDQNNITIQQNNMAIERYIDLDRIRSDAIPLQDQNRLLQQEQDALQVELSRLQDELNGIGQADVAELTAVLVLLANLLSLPLPWVQAAVILFLACLLDMLTVSFIRDGVFDQIMLISPDPEDDLDEAVDDGSTNSAKRTKKPVNDANVTAMTDSYAAFKKMMIFRRDSGHEVLSQRCFIRESGLRERMARQYYQRLVSESVIEKSGGKYEWFGFDKKINVNSRKI